MMRQTVVFMAMVWVGWWGGALPSWAQATSAGHAAADVPARYQEALASPALADSLLRQGRRVAAVCAHCHGEGGNSLKLDVPNLAGQNPAYLLEQLRQFAQGQRRNVFMEGMIKVMSVDERVGMVLFYAQQAVQRRPVSQPSLAAKGQQYYQRVCFRCHGTDGHGNEQLARIAGQQPDYLTTTLKRYRSANGVRVNSAMTANTQAMTDADIEAVVAYVGSME